MSRYTLTSGSLVTQPGRGDNTAWRTARAAAIRRARGACAICHGALEPKAERGTPNATEVDHIVPLSLGGDPYAAHNLRAVHRRCHAKATTALAQYKSGRRIDYQPPAAGAHCGPHSSTYCGGPHSRAW